MGTSVLASVLSPQRDMPVMSLHDKIAYTAGLRAVLNIDCEQTCCMYKLGVKIAVKSTRFSGY